MLTLDEFFESGFHSLGEIADFLSLPPVDGLVAGNEAEVGFRRNVSLSPISVEVVSASLRHHVLGRNSSFDEEPK